MTRDRDNTKRKILEAVGALLARTGFSKVGINTVAREAGVDKALIYRYFGGMPGLLRAFAVHGRFWPTIAELLGGKRESLTSLAEASVTILQGHLAALRSRPVTQEIMRWELQERNELTDELARHREQQGIELMELMNAPAPGQAGGDFAAVAAIVHAGLSYLVLRSKTADSYLGVDLGSEDGWRRIDAAIDEVVRGYVESLARE